MSINRTWVRLLLGCAFVSLSPFANAQIVVPNDAKPTCTVSPVEFKSWFASGTVAANGIVDPADSVTFSNVPNCDFYKWSEQMFLWLTSPAPSKYGAGSHVFDSPVFYDITPQDQNGDRKFVPNGPGIFKNFVATIQQTGPLKKPVVFDNAGRMFPLVVPATGPNGLPQVRNSAGLTAEIARTEVSPTGGAAFVDRENKAVSVPLAANGHPVLPGNNGEPITFSANKILVNNNALFLDAFGNAIATEQGQADAKVIMTQTNHLVYYGLHANDVFAYFDTAIIHGAILPSNAPFPTSVGDLNAIKAFALAHGKTLPDANALAVELKTSWVETAGLANPNQYITINATIPNYTQQTPTQWIPTGTKQATLALVGMHVVGSTRVHPELLWATFEHVNNTPNDTYTYKLVNNTNKTVPKNTAGAWLFSPPNPVGLSNDPRMFLNGSNVQALAGKTIGPSNILRLNAWGTNPASGQAANNNTDIISINNSVLSQLANGDIRKNYIMTGTTWTINGAPSQPASNQVGTNRMANTTMETFSQTTNCFGCHNFNAASPSDVSHVFNDMKPLFP